VRNALRVAVARLHWDDRGAISVLVLLMMWCLVALLAMIWNTAEEATRKQQLQTAADSFAQTGATIMARALNETAAQNMVICQDASTEVIYDAITPTKLAIRSRFDDELTRIRDEQVDTDALHKEMLRRLDAVFRAYGPVEQALDVLDANATVGITDPKEITRRKNEIRRARSVAAWMRDTYVNGGAPTAGRPGPPTYNGWSGLGPIVEHLQPNATDAQILQRIEQFIHEREEPVLADFTSHTNGVLSRNVPSLMQAHRNDVFAEEQQVRSQAMAEIEGQQQQFQSYYKTELASFVLRDPDPQVQSPLEFKPPLRTAGEVPWTWNNYSEDVHHDLIRPRYPDATIKEFGFPYYDFAIDAINSQTGAERLWHPAIPVSFAALGVGASIGMVCEPPGGWGHSYATPIERYLYSRVDADQAGLNNQFMQDLDRRRYKELQDIIRNLMGLPDKGSVSPLPQTIPDDQPDPLIPDRKVFQQLSVPYRLAPPPQAIQAYAMYNNAAGAYRIAIHRLWLSIQSYVDAYTYFVQPFAAAAWYGNVHAARAWMLQNLGSQRQFMVLRTYELRIPPEWAVPGLLSNVYAAALNEIVERNLPRAMGPVVDQLVALDPDIQKPFLDTDELHAYYYQKALGPVRNALRGAAGVPGGPADLISQEWVSRPWPYEIAPPGTAPSSATGLGRQDRQNFFTVVAAARETPQTSPRQIMQFVFKPHETKMVAVAQAEAFDWMEFNTGYGGADQYEQVVTVPWEGPWSRYRHFVGAPRSWRDSTIGAWNYRSRLSLGDAVFQAAQDNAGNSPSLRDMLNSAGISTSDKGSFDELQLH
jgi:hypothetical protein